MSLTPLRSRALPLALLLYLAALTSPAFAKVSKGSAAKPAPAATTAASCGGVKGAGKGSASAKAARPKKGGD